MTASAPTIVATSGGYRPGTRTPLELDALVGHAVERAGVSGRRPRLAFLGTAGGDQQFRIAMMAEAARVAGYELTPLQLFTMPNVADVEAQLLDADVVWVDGGSVANLLAVWRVHSLDEIFPRVWQAGVVLAGISAGSICWFTGGTTDSFGPRLRPVTDGLGLLPYGNGVHYDSEDGRRPLVRELVGPAPCRRPTAPMTAQVWSSRGRSWPRWSPSGTGQLATWCVGNRPARSPRNAWTRGGCPSQPPRVVRVLRGTRSG